jgi:general stress protein YciG
MVDVDAVFRAQMRALGQRGGAATKRRLRNDPMYFREIGRLGGIASAEARRARIAGEVVAADGDDLAIDERAQVPPVRPKALSAVEELVRTIEALNAPRTPPRS